MHLLRAPVFATLVLAGIGCSNQGLDDAQFQTGSSTLAVSADHHHTFVVNTDQGTISELSAEGDVLAELAVGGEPTRIARLGDRLVVTLRTDRAVAIVEDTDDGLELLRTVPTGAEPFGVVAAEDGSRFFVAASQSGVVQEFDGESLEMTREFSVEAEPRFLALKPNGKALYVGSGNRGLISTISLGDGGVTTTLPQTVIGQLGPDATVDLTPRITGDLTVSPDGRFLAVPVLYVENTTPGEPATVPGQGYYVQAGGGRFNPALSLIPSAPTGALDVDGGETIDLTVLDVDRTSVGSYPSSVTISPQGETAVVTMEGSDALIILDSTNFGGLPDNAGGFGNPEAQFTLRTNLVVDAGSTPRAVAFTDDGEAWVHNWLDHEVSRLDMAYPLSLLADARDEGTGLARGTGTASIIEVAAHRTFDARSVTDAVLSPEIEEGRRLFYAARDSRMSDATSGVSCATCHFDGRTDGLNWPFPEPLGPRQTPSLAGVISETAPVTWDSNIDSVGTEVMITSGSRMGGNAGPNEAAAIAAFVDWTREVDVARKGEDDASIARGQALFEREDVGCADCHSGAALTDNEPYAMYGLDAVTTRSLVGIAATAPYLHDGSAATLMDVLISARTGSMGDTGSLDDAQMADLVAYLESL